MGFSLGGARKQFTPREDWALVSIAGSERGLLPIQLQKVLYLLGQRYPTIVGGTFYAFRAVAAGQFSEDIYTDAEALAESGMITIDHTADDRRYTVTAAGAARAKTLKKSVRPDVVEYLQSVISWASLHTVDQLRRATLDVPRPANLTPKNGRPHS